jgi:hypothetical protein
MIALQEALHLESQEFPEKRVQKTLARDFKDI